MGTLHQVFLVGSGSCDLARRCHNDPAPFTRVDCLGSMDGIRLSTEVLEELQNVKSTEMSRYRKIRDAESLRVFFDDSELEDDTDLTIVEIRTSVIIFHPPGSGHEALERAERIWKVDDVEYFVGYSYQMVWSAHSDNEIRCLCICVYGKQEMHNVSFLTDINSLEEIDFQKGPVHCLGPVGRLSHLRKIALLRIMIGDNDVISMGESRSLECIEMDDCYGVHNVSPLERINTLQHLHCIGGDEIYAFGGLGRLPNLKVLRLGTVMRNNGYILSEIVGLSKSRSIDSLSLSFADDWLFTSQRFGEYHKGLVDVSPLASITSLRKVDLYDLLEGFGEFGMLPNLSSLSVSSERVEEMDIRGLSRSRSLKDFYLRSCKEHVDVSFLSSISTLEKVRITNCGLVSGASHFKNTPHLKWMHLDENILSRAQLRDIFEQNSHVKIGLLFQRKSKFGDRNCTYYSSKMLDRSSFQE